MDNENVKHNEYIQKPGGYYVFEFRGRLFCGWLSAIEIAFNGRRTFTFEFLDENLYAVLRSTSQKTRVKEIKVETSVVKFYVVDLQLSIGG